MDTQKSTIEALQNRIKYLEAHLHLALQVLDSMEREIQTCSQNLEGKSQTQFVDHFIDVVPTSRVNLPTFLNSRTWKHQHPDIKNLYESRDRPMSNAS
jgi:hypothetical protein